jgi:hypothetical protein
VLSSSEDGSGSREKLKAESLIIQHGKNPFSSHPSAWRGEVENNRKAAAAPS